MSSHSGCIARNDTVTNYSMRYTLFLLPFVACFAQPTLHVKTPMPSPAWALLEREVLRYNSLAVEEFARKFVDERGYLLHTPQR